MNRNERLITLVLLAEARKAGWELEGLYDDEQEHKNLAEAEAITLANNLETCVWMFKLPKAKAADGKTHRGNVRMIFDNGDEGLTVISDHHMSLSKFQDFDSEKPAHQRTQSEHRCGFMEVVDAFRDELEAYVQGQDACYPLPSAKYLRRDRLELHAEEMFLHLTALVRDHGRRRQADSSNPDYKGDELLPADQQDLHVANAMQLLERMGFSAA